MSEELVRLDRLQKNPFQPRMEVDLEAIESLAANIEANATEDFDGLIQPPTVRPRDGGYYQLAVGHRRVAAFLQLLGQGKNRYELMRVVIRELTDEQMFELAISENIQRKDLTPIEEARAMHTYMTTFGKTSQQAAERFGVSPETVRGKVRLLNLPESIQEKLGSGELSESTARKLLTVHQIDPKAAEAAAKEITNLRTPTAYDVEEALESAIERNKEVVEMWYQHQTGEPCGGSDLWPLTWQHKGAVQPLTAAEIEAFLNLSKKDLKALRPRIDDLVGVLAAGMEVIPGNFSEFPEEVLERLARLSNPPACTDCPLQNTINENIYCGMKACHDRKRAAWLQGELARLSKKMGIAMYNPETDGKAFVKYTNRYSDDANSFRTRIRAKNKDLRLMVAHNLHQNNPGTDHREIQVVSLVEVNVKKANSNAAAAAESAKVIARRNRQQKEEEQRRRNIDQARTFIKEIAEPAFAQAFDGLKNVEVLLALVRVHADANFKKQTGPKKLAFLRVRLASEVLREGGRVIDVHWDPKSPLRKGPSGVAVHLQKVAMTWGVKLPRNWLETAKSWGHQDEAEAHEEAEA